MKIHKCLIALSLHLWSMTASAELSQAVKSSVGGFSDRIFTFMVAAVIFSAFGAVAARYLAPSSMGARKAIFQIVSVIGFFVALVISQI